MVQRVCHVEPHQHVTPRTSVDFLAEHTGGHDPPKHCTTRVGSLYVIHVTAAKKRARSQVEQAQVQQC